MARTLSPIQSAIANAVWALGFIIITVLVLGHIAGVTLDNRPILYGLFFGGPVLSAAFCNRFSGVLLGALGLGAGILLAGAAMSMTSINVEWSRAAIFTALISIADLAVSIPIWWCVRRLRRGIAAATSVP
jgi:hypothetical protein